MHLAGNVLNTLIAITGWVSLFFGTGGFILWTILRFQGRNESRDYLADALCGDWPDVPTGLRLPGNGRRGDGARAGQSLAHRTSPRTGQGC